MLLSWLKREGLDKRRSEGRWLAPRVSVPGSLGHAHCLGFANDCITNDGIRFSQVCSAKNYKLVLL